MGLGWRLPAMHLHISSAVVPLALLTTLSLLLACSSSSNAGPGAPPDADAGTPAEDAAPAPDGGPSAPLTWEHRYNGAPIHGLVVNDAGDVFIIGELNGPADFGSGVVTPAAGEVTYLAKLGADGKPAWVKRLRGEMDMQQDWALAADTAGGVYVAGTVSGVVNLGGEDIEMDFTPPATNIVLAHFDKSGTHLASEPLINCHARCEKPLLTASAKGLVVVMTGSETMETPFVLGGTSFVYQGGGVLAYQRAADGSASTARASANGHVFGLTQNPEAGKVYVASSDDLRTTISETGWTGAQSDSWDYTSASLSAFAIDDEKRAFLSGYFPGGNNGATQLVQTLGDTVEWNKGVMKTGDASVTLRDSTIGYDAKTSSSVFAGEFTGKITIDGVDFATKAAPGKDDADIFVVRFDHAGKMIAHQQLGSTNHETVVGLVVLPNRVVVVAGESNGQGYLTRISL
jgi:hypothetical protein